MSYIGLTLFTSTGIAQVGSSTTIDNTINIEDFSEIDLDSFDPANFETAGSAAAAAAGIGALLFNLVLSLVVVIAMWKIFTKAGKPGWAALVPIYNVIVLLDIVRKPWWWIFGLAVPFLNIVVLVIIMNRLSRSFGRGTGTTVGLVLLGFVFLPILGFGNAKYTPLQD